MAVVLVSDDSSGKEKLSVYINTIQQKGMLPVSASVPESDSGRSGCYIGSWENGSKGSVSGFVSALGDS